MVRDGWIRSAIWAALALAGCLLVALPWIERPAVNPLPVEFGSGSDAHVLLLRCVKQVDESCRAGDLEAFRRCVTEGYVDRLEARMRQIGWKLDGKALMATVSGERKDGLLGELRKLPCLGGRRSANHASLVYDYGDGRKAGGIDGLKVLRFLWDGYEFRLDLVRDVRRPPGVDRRELLREALDATLTGLSR
ncbi:MAG: hypothetical protein Fur0037_04500 [Planctomycetota bacterium]